jgi:hypothetical protein
LPFAGRSWKAEANRKRHTVNCSIAWQIHFSLEDDISKVPSGSHLGSACCWPI